jgi:hypothetical protein
MRRCLEFIVVVVTCIALPACGASPTAPGQASPPEFDPTALFARLAGPYTLTVEADEDCLLPGSLKVLTYEVWLEPSPHRYLGVRVPGKDFSGDLWALATEQDGFTLRWNVDCETRDTVGSTSFYLCGEGHAFAITNTTISGVLGTRNAYLDIDRRPFCAIGPHRFVFERRT